MDTLLCNNDGDIVIGTYQPSNTLLSLSADQYTAGSATWSDQSGNGLNFTVSTNASLKGTDANGFPYMNFGGSYGHAKRLVGSTLTNIPAPTTGKYTVFCVTQILNSTASYRTLTRGATEDHPIIVQTGNNNLGLWDSYGSNFVDSGFDVTTDMTSTRNLLVWELSTTAPIYKFQLNESGTDSTINSATSYTLPFASLGGVSDSQYWGNIYEFIVYDGVLSASERTYVAEYLTHKWDISSKLPSSFTSTHGVLTTQETLAFLYAGSGTETTYTWDAEGVTYADILVVGGGGAGRSSSGYAPAGGGGGGEVVYRQGVPVTPGVEIKVGRGGPVATQGGISQFTSSIRANGGGSGGSGSGGSGGGANRNVTTGGASVKLSVDGMGNVGGASISGIVGAAGGGGATQAGFNVTGGSGSNGGEGYATTVFGVWNTVYGSGGGGGDRSGVGGLGGTNAGNGGKHDAADKSGTPGVAHTGSGGGGAGAENGGGTGGLGGSGIVLVKPNPGALDGLGSSVYTQAVGAYALRRLFGAYTGAQVRLRRSTDNAETDVTFDKYGYPVNFDVDTWLGGATGYVVTWYDQSPASSNAAADTVGNQPVLTQFGGKWVVQFDGNTQNLRYSQIDVLSVWCRYYILTGTNNYSTLIGRAGADKSLRQAGDNIGNAGNVGDWIASGTGEWSLNTTIVNKTNARLYSPWVQWNTYTGNRSSSYGNLMNEMGRGSYSGAYRGLNGYMSELILYSTQGALTGKHTSLNQTV